MLRPFFIFFFLPFVFSLNPANSSDFSERENFNKILKSFYKKDIHKCTYINKSWSIGFESQPYGLVMNGAAFKNILVFKHKNIIGTLWSNIGEISLERGVRKYQLWKKTNQDEYELIESDYLSDKNSSDVDTKLTNTEFKSYFDKQTLKISVKSWITDFYSCKKINSSNFARRKLIDIFVNQDVYVKKDFFYREKNPSSFANKIELIKE